MARPYSEKFLLQLNNNQNDLLGIKLAKLCVKANLPATYVAEALETTRTTVYSWFRGQGIRENKRKVVEAFISLVETDLANNDLPVKNTADAKKYIEKLLGITL